jgi:Fur family transcriptional regulator, ferric uptake regulator
LLFGKVTVSAYYCNIIALINVKRRNTPSKQAVLDILSSANGALSQESIALQVGDTMDRVTVYRILNRFCEDGQAHRIVSDDGRQYFALCVNCDDHGHHHDHFHFRCLGCRKVECLEQEVSFRVPEGYRLESVHCLLTGYCPACA